MAVQQLVLTQAVLIGSVGSNRCIGADTGHRHPPSPGERIVCIVRQAESRWPCGEHALSCTWQTTGWFRVHSLDAPDSGFHREGTHAFVVSPRRQPRWILGMVQADPRAMAAPSPAWPSCWVSLQGQPVQPDPSPSPSLPESWFHHCPYPGPRPCPCPG